MATQDPPATETFCELHQSPLSMAMHDPVLHQLISYLTEKKAEQEANPEAPVKLELDRELIDKVRESFRDSILDGERQLHALAHLLASALLGEFELHSNVIGVLPGDEDRPFLIRERIMRETLFSVTDIDLGNHMLANFQYHRDDRWVPLQLAANFVEYLPLARPASGVNRLTSRVKAEEELWNKVTDEIFMLDDLVSRDKHLQQYSKYIKDIFGIKIVCEDDDTCLVVHEQLHSILLSSDELKRINIAIELGEKSKSHLEFIETKDYLTCPRSQMKKTGWKALKSVVRWQGRLFEIQIQPLGNYYLELDHMSGPSHRSFKISRDKVRDQISERVPLYGVYRNLLKNLFKGTEASVESETASVVIA